MTEVVIANACRTPIGSLGGVLASLSAPELASIAIREALRRAAVAPEEVSETILGHVLTAGVGQAPARQATARANRDGLPMANESRSSWVIQKEKLSPASMCRPRTEARL